MTLQELQEELITIEPRRDFLHEILGCGMFLEVTQTSDGFWLGCKEGDCGFNTFLGKPSQNALDRTSQFLSKLSEPARKLADSILAKYNF